MDSAPAQPQKHVSAQEEMSSITWKLNNLETKVRINEQNVINDRRHVQLLNGNVLAMKKEFREKLDKILQQRTDYAKGIADLTNRVSALEGQMKKAVKRTEISAMQKFHEHFNYFDNEMSKEEADRILDDILKTTENKSKLV